MPVPATGSARLRVGEFEVDLRCGEVRCNGDRVKLQERPFQILAALLERPGEVVTREEIRQKLWPTNTFVDFEHSINTAVNKLRGALGDDAENPRFIETLPRYGYRLIAPVEIVEPHGARPAVEIGPLPPQQVSPPETQKALAFSRAGPRPRCPACNCLCCTFFPISLASLRSPFTQPVGADHQFCRLCNFACVVS